MTGGHTPAVLAAAVAQMAGSYRTRTRLHLLDLNHNFIMDLSGLRVSDGAITVSADQAITRSMSLQLVDRTDMLGLTGLSSAPKFLMPSWKGIYVDSLAQWVDFPMGVFYVTKPTRIGDLLTIEGQDKGALGSFPTSSLTIKKGTNIMRAIRMVMAERAGETRFRLESWGETLRRDFVLDDQTTPLALAKEMAAQIGIRLFYDGEGYLTGTSRMRGWGSAFTFQSGIGGTLASEVSTGYWDREIYNRVLVDGPVVSGKKITASAVLPASHPLSPEKLMRGGAIESGRRTFRYSSNTLKTRDAAGDWAEKKLRSLALQQQTATFSSAPVWHLQEFDVVRVLDPLDGIDLLVQWSQASIPMTCDGLQSNGFTTRSGPSFGHARVRTRSRWTKAGLRARRAALKKKRKG